MEDIDMDIDFGEPIDATDPEIELAPAVVEQAPLLLESTILPTDEPVLNKVHLRGLDDLTTKDIKDFASEHFPSHKPKVEWIDDTSANLVFDSEDLAGQALRSFSLTFNGELPHNLQLRTAKSSSAHPSAGFQVRMATVTDRKPPRAHERSRFYMMHPEHDPREQERYGSRSRNRDDRNGRLSRRRRSIERNHFDESMYDDDADALARRKRNSRSSFSSGDMRDVSRSRDRARSASPARSNRRHANRRRTPPPRYSRKDPHPAARDENIGKELFPKGTTANKTAAANIKKELFPRLKAGSSALHRRTNSIDATNDPTSDLLSSSMSSKMVTPLVDGANDSFPLRSDSIEHRSPGFSIKGAAATQDQGFSIRGAADQKVRELFPSKVSNRGKELFANRERNRADMFY